MSRKLYLLKPPAFPDYALQHSVHLMPFLPGCHRLVPRDLFRHTRRLVVPPVDMAARLLVCSRRPLSSLLLLPAFVFASESHTVRVRSYLTKARRVKALSVIRKATIVSNLWVTRPLLSPYNWSFPLVLLAELLPIAG